MREFAFRNWIRFGFGRILYDLLVLLYWNLVEKTPEEQAALEARKAQQKALKEARKKEQQERIEKKKAAKAKGKDKKEGDESDNDGITLFCSFNSLCSFPFYGNDSSKNIDPRAKGND